MTDEVIQKRIADALERLESAMLRFDTATRTVARVQEEHIAATLRQQALSEWLMAASKEQRLVRDEIDELLNEIRGG